MTLSISQLSRAGVPAAPPLRATPSPPVRPSRPRPHRRRCRQPRHRRRRRPGHPNKRPGPPRAKPVFVSHRAWSGKGVSGENRLCSTMAVLLRVSRWSCWASLRIAGMPTMKCRTLATIAAAMGIAVTSCAQDTHYAGSPLRCGSNGGGIAGLPAPAPIWTYARRTPSITPRAAPTSTVTAGWRLSSPAGAKCPPRAGRRAGRGHRCRPVARDGRDGALLEPGAPRCDGDGVQDVFVGGRLESFMALDGASGDVSGASRTRARCPNTTSTTSTRRS